MVKKFRPEQTRRRNDLLNDLAESVAYELAKHGLDMEQAKVSGEEVALKIHENWRGMSVVFPMHPELVRQRLRAAIVAEYDGTNTFDLVRKYRIAENTIHKWVAEERQRRLDESQGNLFSDDDDDDPNGRV